MTNTRPTKPADVVFLFPPAAGNPGAFAHHLGVSYLRAALLGQSIATLQYTSPAPGSVESVAADVLKHKPGVVGFTVYDGNFTLSVALAGCIKRRRPGVRVVFGGPSATFCASRILERHRDVDACVVGEAEETGARIFRALLDSRDVVDVPAGLVVRRGSEILQGPTAPLVGARNGLPAACALDAVPSPYLAGLLEDGRTGILTGRGCTHHCQYCCFAALGRRTLRLHSTARVLEELEHIAATQKLRGERYVVPVHDDAFTLLPERARSLCQGIIDRRLDLVLSCITRADAVDGELLRLMRGAGFVSLAFGLESAVPSVLRAIGKVRPPGWPGHDLEPEREFVERVRQSVTTAHELGFNVGVSVILGLPTETLEDGEETLRLVGSLPLDTYVHNFLWVFPGTPLWDARERFGIGCSIDSSGLAVTTEYAYDVTRLRPRRHCSLEQEARAMKSLAVDALRDCGTPPSHRGGTSVAVLDAGELAPETGRWLAGILDVGGILVQLYPGPARQVGSARIDADRQAFRDALVPARHHLQVLRTSSRGSLQRWRLVSGGTDVYGAHKPAVLSFTTCDTEAPLLEWMRGADARCVSCDVARYMTRPTKLEGFHARCGSEGSARLRRMPAPPGLHYPARWLRGAAPCLSLARLEIDCAGRVRTCRHGEVIGSVGEGRRVLARRLRGFVAEAQLRRGCASCQAAGCPRCPFPALDDAEYCQVMRGSAPALRVLAWTHAYSRIPSILSVG